MHKKKISQKQKKPKDSGDKWSIEKSAHLYGIQHWGSDYFSINAKGNIEVSPHSHTKNKQASSADLHEIIEGLLERGVRLPILLRFSDILNSRLELLSNCFNKAIQDYKYLGKYKGVYPIKVNQQKHLVDDIIRCGEPINLGLECGSKPELLIALSVMNNPNALIICNGFKDFKYIETALLSLKLGRQTIIVVDRMAEIQLIIDASKKLNIKPRIGFRARLNRRATGRWAETTGARAKFGLTPSEIVQATEILKENHLLTSLELLHFHMGSQIPSIQSIKTSIREGARFFSELKSMAPKLKYIDVGGGLGVDYDGSGKSDSSTNYHEQEYANDVVNIIQEICDEKNIEHPTIVTESGRSLVAHSTALIFNVLGSSKVKKENYNIPVSFKDSSVVKALRDILENICLENVNEFYNDLIEKRRDSLQLFTYGLLDLIQRAKAEDLYWAIATKIVHITQGQKDFDDIFYSLEQELSDTYFCNFSLFQSLPDSWALDQVFPVMPIHRLNEKPENRAVLADLTCDSDGKLTNYIDIEEDKPQNYLEVHHLKKNKPYYLGVFLTGAYQEILGDLHNLFGDTDAVHISINEEGYSVDHVVQGDSVNEVLSYLEYFKPDLIEKIRRSSEIGITNGNLSRAEARLLMKHYQEGLSGYTYFED